MAGSTCSVTSSTRRSLSATSRVRVTAPVRTSKLVFEGMPLPMLPWLPEMAATTAPCLTRTQ